MKIAYLQKRGNTAAWIGSGIDGPGMIGVARKRPGDRYRPIVGLAVALLKAEFGGPFGQDRDVMMVEPSKDDIKKSELTDLQVLVWANLRYGMRVGLSAVRDRRAREEVLHRPGWRMDTCPPEISSIPSDGQLCENFAIRFISEADLQID